MVSQETGDKAEYVLDADYATQNWKVVLILSEKTDKEAEGEDHYSEWKP